MGSRLEANSNAVRKRIEQHTFDDEAGDEYEASAFGGFSDYFRRKKIKLQNIDAERRRQSVDNPKIFRGVVVHVNGYTQPSLNDLHGLIIDHGGGFMQYLDGKTTVTHIVASNLTLKKAVEFRKYRIVKPAWVVDSVAAGKLLPWSTYRLLDEGARQNVLGFENGAVTSQASTQQRGYKYQTETSWYTNQVQKFARQVDDPAATVLPTDDPTVAKTNQDESDEDDQWPLEAREPILDEDMAAASFSDSFRLSGLDDNDLLEAGEEEAVVCNDSTSRNPEESIEDTNLPLLRQDMQAEPDVAVHTPSKSSKATEGRLTPSKKPSTAEEHNAVLLADPKIWKSTVVNPGFLKQYYEESRLHHLSTWKADLKSKLQARAQEQTPSQKGRQKRPAGARRYVLHVDFDCFFAAVSLRQFPQYQDKPTVVAHGGGSGAEIASCNYHARKFGVKNGMWMRSAQELCPDLKVLPYDFTAYEEVSRQFYDAVMDTGGIVQSVSVDEALVDISVACFEAGGHNGKGTHESSMNREQMKADEIAQGLRDRIKEDTGCAVSVGIGGNILLAKLALRKAKPAGQHHVKPDEAMGFVGEFTVQELPGVAWSLGRKLKELGVELVKDVRNLSKERLMTTLGPKTGQKLWEYARGVDRVEVGDQVVRKSVSAEVNWGVRFVTQEQVDDFMRSICEELHNRLLNEGVKGQQLTLKIMKRAADTGLDPPKHLGHGKCDVFNKSVVLGESTNDDKVLSRESITLLRGFGFTPGDLRGIGLQMTKLETLVKGPLQGGQRRLQFRATEKGVQADDADRLDIIETPEKPKNLVKHEAAALIRASEQRSSRPLNIMGSQFVLPSQVDPAVLAALPEDIRSKLTAQTKSTKKDPRQNTLEFTSRSISPPAKDSSRPPTRQSAPSPPPVDIPSASQIDPETLAALPIDLREEVLAFYAPAPQAAQTPAQHPSPNTPRQVLLPHSPESNRTTKQLPKQPTPTKRGRGRPRGGARIVHDSHSGLLQSNFVPHSHDAKTSETTEITETMDEISADFLAALPADLRAEVLAQHRSSRLQARGGLSIPTVPQRLRAEQAARESEIEGSPPRFVELPPSAPRPTFTERNLSTLPQLRDAVEEWVSAMEGDGPEDKDVAALGEFLSRVVGEERDMHKAVAVVNWLEWAVGEYNWDGDGNQEGWEGEERESQGKREWLGALAQVKDAVTKAIVTRGLAPPKF